MNEIRISGIIQGIVEHNSKTGTFLTASLKFRRDGHTILLIAAGALIRELQPFDDGDLRARAIGDVQGRSGPFDRRVRALGNRQAQ